MASKYAVRYWSMSRKEFIDIESMHSGHLLNAWKKAKNEFEYDDLTAALEAEVKARGLDKPREEATP